MSRQKAGIVYLDPVKTSVIVYVYVPKAKGCKCSREKHIVQVTSGDGKTFPAFDNEEKARAFIERVTRTWKGIFLFKSDKDEFYFNPGLVRRVAFGPNSRSSVVVSIDQLTFRFGIQDPKAIEAAEACLTSRTLQFIKLGPECFECFGG